MAHSDIDQHFSAARYIKEIGRGPKGSRDLSREESRELYAAMLDGRVSDLELGAIWVAMRIKGEAVDEITGFLEAAEASFDRLASPLSEYAPIVIPSYSGSRQMPNLTPLLAMLLAQAGAPVLVHGVPHDAKRVTSADIFRQLGVEPAKDAAEAAVRFSRHQPAFMQIEALAPRIARLLAMRDIIGVRSSTHTIVKIIQPFSGPALRLVSYTHPEYLELLDAYFRTSFATARGDTFLMRGTEGEVVANLKRAQKIDWFHDGESTTLVERQEPNDEALPLPVERDAVSTACWIKAVMNGEEVVPAAIAGQVEHCLQISRKLRERQNRDFPDS